MNYRTFFGLMFTTFWLAGGLIYFHLSHGLGDFLALKPNELGDFAAGYLAPLAFLWLVIGYFQQGEEQRLQRPELELQCNEFALQRAETHRLADEAARQVSASEFNERYARRQSIWTFYKLAMLHLDGIAVDVARRTAGGDINANMWNAYERGDREVYYRSVVSQIVQGRHRAIVDRLENSQIGLNR